MQAYTDALGLLPCSSGSEGDGNAAAPACPPGATCTACGGDPATNLRLPLLTNRALARHRLGKYAAAAEDAEAALQLDPSNVKAAFRAAAAHLALGDGISAERHASMLSSRGDAPGAGINVAPAGWGAVTQHAAALAAHQRRVEAIHQGQHAYPQAQSSLQPHMEALLGSLQAEAEGEDAELPGGPVHMLQQLATLLGDGEGVAAAEAAAVLCAAPGQRGWRLLLFFLADPDPACQAAAAAALRAAGRAAALNSSAVLWPAEVWRRLLAAALAAGRSAGSDPLSVAPMQLLVWAAERDAWVLQQLLTHPLPGGEPAVDEPDTAGLAPLTQLSALLINASKLQLVEPEAVVAAAKLLRLYASDPAAAEALGNLGCRPLLALLRAASSAEGMAAFQQPGDEANAGSTSAVAAAAEGPAGEQVDAAAGTAAAAAAGAQTEDPEQAALQALRRKRRAIYDGELVALRRALLGALAELAGSCRELLLVECVVREGHAGWASKRKVSAGAFLTGEPTNSARCMHKREQGRCMYCGPRGTTKTRRACPALAVPDHESRCSASEPTPCARAQSYLPWRGSCTSNSHGGAKRCLAPTERRARTQSATLRPTTATTLRVGRAGCKASACPGQRRCAHVPACVHLSAYGCLS